MTEADRIIGVCAVLCSTIAEAMGQLAFKSAANRPDVATNAKPVAHEIGNSFGNSLRTTVRNFRWVLCGWVSFAVQASLWSFALYHLDVSVAHPIGGLTFVVVAIASRFVLGEQISPRRWAGIAFIVAGSVLVALN